MLVANTRTIVEGLGGVRLLSLYNGKLYWCRAKTLLNYNRAIITAQAENKTPSVDFRGKFTGGILYQLKNGCNWADLPKDFPPYSTVLWHYKQWCEDDILDKIMTELHGRVREQVKKSLSGQL